MTRAVLHVDMDAFYASVEQHDNPQLAGQPVLVGWEGERGVVTTASYEARPFGVHSAMPMRTARRLCPQAICVRPRMARYQEVSAIVFGVFLMPDGFLLPYVFRTSRLDAQLSANSGPSD